MKAALLALLLLGGCAEAAINAAGQMVLGIAYPREQGGKK